MMDARELMPKCYAHLSDFQLRERRSIFQVLLDATNHETSYWGAKDRRHLKDVIDIIDYELNARQGQERLF